jgi:hypothetical protein
MRPITAGFVALASLLTPAWIEAKTADAEENETVMSETADVVDRARHYFGIARSVTGCSSARTNDEIVVCGIRKPDPRYAPPPPAASPDAKTIALGAPPSGRGAGVGVRIKGCILQKCPRELYFIDLNTIPEPPPGSDADKIARGEMRAR